jgi:hypothetical protein
MPKLKLESGDGRALHRQLSRLILRLARLAIVGWAKSVELYSSDASLKIMMHPPTQRQALVIVSALRVPPREWVYFSLSSLPYAALSES